MISRVGQLHGEQFEIPEKLRVWLPLSSRAVWNITQRASCCNQVCVHFLGLQYNGFSICTET